jgi:hypothetical protein
MSGELDEVYERMRATGPEFDGWLSNHGPMAADALLRLAAGAGAAVDVHAWLDGYARRLEEAPRPRRPIAAADWQAALGDPGRLGDWPAFFDRELAEQPWEQVLAGWWPRLVPGSLASATHGLIRTGHAVRALREVVTPARVGELAQALGYWAARWIPAPAVPAPGARASSGPGPAAPDDVPRALEHLVDGAVAGYGRWAAGSPVMLVHAATAPRAAALVLPSLPRELWIPTYRAAAATVATLEAAYRSATPVPGPPVDGAVDELVARAAAHGDEHVLKFAEVAVESAARGEPTAVGAGLRAVALID